MYGRTYSRIVSTLWPHYYTFQYANSQNKRSAIPTPTQTCLLSHTWVHWVIHSIHSIHSFLLPFDGSKIEFLYQSETTTFFLNALALLSNLIAKFTMRETPRYYQTRLTLLMILEHKQCCGVVKSTSRYTRAINASSHLFCIQIQFIYVSVWPWVIVYAPRLWTPEHQWSEWIKRKCSKCLYAHMFV